MATQQQPSRPTQLTRHTVNGFRYQVAVITKGRAVFVQVVEWLYQGRPCIKSHFLSLGKSRADYKRKFNSEQRTLLEKGAPFKEFDISLLYIILQLMCGLADPSNPAWTSPPSGQPLEHLLHKLKLMRNHIAHTNDVQQMSDQELFKKLRKLKCLLSRILRLAGNRCGIHPHIFRDQVWEIKQYFQGLLQKVREPLESSDLNNFPQLQQEIKVFQEALRNKVERDSRQELQGLYPQLWDVTLAQWLYPDLKIQPSLNFTNLVIVEDTSTLSPSQEQKHQPCNISHKNLLQVKQRNGRLPEVIVISGEGGIGKTTLLKHMLEMWVKDPSQIEGLQDASLLLYLQLRGCTISSWNNLLMSLLDNTFQGSGLTTDVFVDLFLAMNIVVLLDGYDEVSKKAKKLITDLLCYPGNMRIVITTRPGCAKELTQIMKNKRQVINVEIRGIRREDRAHFIESTLAALVQDTTRREKLKEKIVTNLKTINLEKGTLDIPLTLTLAVIREVETPGQSSPDIYGDLTALMMDKIRERLARKGIHGVNEEVKQYHEFQKAIALQGLKTREHDLLSETVEKLKAKCESLNLPYKEIFSGFLVSKKSRQGLFITVIWSFPHNQFQEYWAAGYITTQLSTMQLPDLAELQEIPTLTDIETRRKICMKVLPLDEEIVELMVRSNPILQIYADGIEEAKRLSWLSISTESVMLLVDILFNITRILAMSHKDLLGKVATAIINFILYIDQLSLEECDRIFQMVMVSEQHPKIVEVCASILKERDILSIGGNYLPELVPLVDYMKPCSLEIFTEKKEEELRPNQQICALEELAKKDIEISLHIRSIWDTDMSETCLKIFNCQGTLAQLTKFNGSLAASGMEFLPESLRKLKTSSDREGMMALLKRLPLLRKLHDLNFSGSLTKVEIELLPKVLQNLDVTTDGEGLRALARRLPHLKYLYRLEICLLDCPMPDTLLDLPYEGFLKLNLRKVSPPHWLWVCDALQVLLTTRTEKALVVFPPCCDEIFETIEEELIRRETISVRSFISWPTQINVERKKAPKVSRGGYCTVT
ncbi:uncharacterized protein LOC119597613 [Penaeus monodon]|uniref:uncharacterized protein LOC119597613 n=1 Tax=Penaeus monodon TaxID=6687 RepID=UPI0018A79DBE|nr:uncharacterized protein LOC119597613 [Penaeus monodon]